MRTSAASTLALLAVALPAAAQAPKWTAFAPKGEGFSVLLPAAPKPVTQSVQGVTTHIYLATLPSLVCVVSKSTLPGNFGKANVDAMGAAMRDSMLRSANATATGSRKATFAGIVGDRTDFKTSAGRAGAAWVGHAPGAMYFLVMAKQGGASAAEIARFFGSFRRS